MDKEREAPQKEEPKQQKQEEEKAEQADEKQESTFKGLGVCDELCQACAELHYEKPTEIQS